jgi:WD40 repeat protein
MRTLSAVFFLLLAVDPAHAKFDPVHRWRTLQTPHFTIHFHEGCDELAARAAPIAEQAHELLASRVGWTPREKTRLIIADDADTASGWATPYPYNQILITPTPPLGEFGLGTTRHDDWLRLVITHEYTHVLQLDMASRFPLALRSVFGRLYFPNAIQPEWLIEGLATFEETELTAGGRGRSPGSAMILRMAALAGPLPTLDQMAVTPDAWPAGQVPYLFGESFLRYLAERFGRDKIADLSRDYGGRPLPFLVESNGRETLGEEYRDLWAAWSANLRAQSGELARTLASRGLTLSTALTTDGRVNVAPAWSPDGRRIAWLRADGYDFPGIWVMNADGSQRRRLADNAFSTNSSGTTLAWSPDGRRLYYTKQDVLRGAAIVNDIWAWDFARGRETRITRGLRARDPHPSPDGRTLALVTAARGLTRLALLDLGAQLPARTQSRLRPLGELSADQLAEPRWSPDGLRIALSAWIPGGETEIRILDREGRLLARVGRGRAVVGAPAWSPDGRTLFFSSDTTGVFNIFAWDARTGDTAQVTNVLGGAFSPAPSPDGRRLAFTDYTARGYDIRLMELNVSEQQATLGGTAIPLEPAGRRGGAEGRSPAAERSEHSEEVPASLLRPAIRSQDERDREHTKQGTSTDERANGRVDGGPQRQDPAAWTGRAVASTSYSPLDTILPRLWLPWAAYSPASGTMLGLVTGGQDVLQRHRYTLTGLYGPKNGRFMYWADYAYDGLRPTLRLSSSDFDRTYGGLLQDAHGSADYTERRRSIGADVSLDFPGFDSSQAITVGYRYRELSGLTPVPPWPGYNGVQPATGPLGSTHLSWAFSNAHLLPLSISPTDGRRLEFGLEHYQEGLGSEYTFTQASLDWNEYVALPAPRHVLATRLFVGGIDGGPPQQGVFSLGGNAPGGIEYALDDTVLLLRGYPPDTFRGEQAVLVSLEYRFPLVEVGRGGVSAPFFLRRLHGALFVDAGEAWTDDTFRADGLHAGIGAEIRFDLLFSYFLPVTVRLGLAAGLGEEGGVYPTLGIQMP